jgi:hypothetical protein
MTKDKFTLNHSEAMRSLDSYTCREPGSLLRRLIALPDLFDVLLRVAAVSQPEYVSIALEEPSNGPIERLRLILCDHRESPRIGVTRDYEREALQTNELRPNAVIAGIEKLLDHANEVLLALRALRLGKERVEYETDYSDPKNLITLLENRDCIVFHRDTVSRLVREKPGPIYYGDIDLVEDGGSWGDSGGRWADEMERRLIQLKAVIRF